MRIPRRSAAVLGVAAFTILLGATVAARGRDTSAKPEAVSWLGLVGESRAATLAGQRSIVLLNTPSVATRLARARYATEAQERSWTTQAFAAQQQVLTKLAALGVTVRPDYSYARVIDGFAAALDPRAISLLGQMPEVAGVFPVRAAFPASISEQLLASNEFGPSSGHRATAELPGYDGRGVTIALLDTGVDESHPYLRGRVLPGIDVVDHARRRNGTCGSAGSVAGRAARHRDGGHPRRLRRAWRPARRCARSDRPADPRGRLAGGRRRARRRVRTHRPGDRGARACRRPERRRRRARRGPRGASWRGRAVRGVHRRSRGPGRPGRARPEHARGHARRQRRHRRPDVRLDRRPRRRARRARGRRHRFARRSAARSRRPAPRPRRDPRREAAAARRRGAVAFAEPPRRDPSLDQGPRRIADRRLLQREGAQHRRGPGGGRAGGCRSAGGRDRGIASRSRGCRPLRRVASARCVAGLGGRDRARRRRADRQLRWSCSPHSAQASTSESRSERSTTTRTARAARWRASPRLASPSTVASSRTSPRPGSRSRRRAGSRCRRVAALRHGQRHERGGGDRRRSRCAPRPDATEPRRASLDSLLVGYAQQGRAPSTAVGAGTFRLGASAVGEVAAQPTTLGFGIWQGAHWHATRTLVVRNVSTRRLQFSISAVAGGESEALSFTVVPKHLVLRVGRAARVQVTVRAACRAERADRHRCGADRGLGLRAAARPVGARPSASAPDTLLGPVSIDRASFPASDTDPGDPQRAGREPRTRQRPADPGRLAAGHPALLGERQVPRRDGPPARPAARLVQLRHHGSRADERPPARPAPTSCGSLRGRRCR